MQQLFITFIALAFDPGYTLQATVKAKRYISNQPVAFSYAEFDHFFAELEKPSIQHDLHLFEVTLPSYGGYYGDIKPVNEESDYQIQTQVPAIGSASPVSVGSGSLGVVQLTNGGFVLGSGSIGYQPTRNLNSVSVMRTVQPNQQIQQVVLQIPQPVQQQLPQQVSQPQIQKVQPLVNNQIDANIYSFLPQKSISLSYFPVSTPVQQVPQFLQFYTPNVNLLQINSTQPIQSLPAPPEQVTRKIPTTHGYSTTPGLSGYSP